MPFLNRYWWLRIPHAVALVGLALASVAFLLLTLSQAPDDWLSVLAWLGLISLALVSVALWTVVRLWAARDKTLRRKVAIAGDQEAIPLAGSIGMRADATQAVSSLSMTFPLTLWDRPALALLRVFASLPLFGVIGVLLVVFRLEDGMNWPWQFWAFIALLIIATSGRWMNTVARAIERTYHMPRSLVADTVGIRWQPIVGCERMMRWDEMRLLEVAGFDPALVGSDLHAKRRRYTLYTRNAAIWWSEPGGLFAAPQGHYAQLLALINARTALEPRTFNDELRTPDVRYAVARVPESASASEDDTAYLLSSPLPSRHGRVIAAFFGLLLSALATIAVVWLLARFGFVTLPHIVQVAILCVHGISAFFMLAGGMIGVPLLVGAIRATPAQRLSRLGGISADATGLSTYPPTTGSMIAWSDVASIQVGAIWPAKFYIVRSAVDDTSILWAKKRTERYAPAMLVTALGFTPISSDELVALVMRRTGKPLTTRNATLSASEAPHALS